MYKVTIKDIPPVDGYSMVYVLHGVHNHTLASPISQATSINSLASPISQAAPIDPNPTLPATSTHFQIRGEEREEVAKTIINQFNSSVSAYKRDLLGTGHMLTEIGTESQYKNCVRDYNAKHRIGDRLTELIAVSTSQHSMSLIEDIKGFVQMIVPFPYFHIVCY